MSTILQQQLTPTLVGLSTLSQEAEDALSAPNTPASLKDLGTVGEKLARNIRTAEILLDKWSDLMANPDADIRAEEKALFQNYKVANLVPGEILRRALEAQTGLDLKVQFIRAAIPPSAPPSFVPAAAAGVLPSIKLPSLQLPDFDGQDSSWPSFWASFDHSIHQNAALTGAQKLAYLVGRLRGAARTLVDGFAITDGNYQFVVDLLKGRFGDDKKRADRLRSELFHLPKPTGNTNSLRNFSECVDRICRQLESLGPNLDNNPFLTVAIKEKLPVDIRAQLYNKEMEGGVTWSSKEWRERLNKAVKLKEAVHNSWESVPPPPSHSNAKVPPAANEPIKRSFPVVSEPYYV